jgi:hypothetical protein
MQATDTIIHIDPETPLGRALDARPREPIVLVRGERRYRIVPEDPWEDYDPDRLLRALHAVAGTLTPEQGEQLKRDLYRRREEGTQNPDCS